MRNRLEIILVILFLIAVNVYGNNLFQFLLIQPGARATGMGEVYAGLAEGGDALYWNPGGLVNIGRAELAFTHMIYLQGMNYDYLTYVTPLTNSSAIGFGILGLFSTDIPQTSEDVLGNLLETTNTFGTSEIAVICSLSRRLIESFSIGISFKYINQQIANAGKTGFSADLGGLLIINKFLKLGINIQNIGDKVGGKDLPGNTKLGCNYSLSEKGINLGIELNQPTDGEVSIGLGIEKSIVDAFLIRAGYNSLVETGGMGGLHMGVGFEVKEKYQVDYSVSPYGDIGTIHKISTNFSFGPSLGSLEWEEKRIRRKRKKDDLDRKFAGFGKYWLFGLTIPYNTFGGDFTGLGYLYNDEEAIMIPKIESATGIGIVLGGKGSSNMKGYSYELSFQESRHKGSWANLSIPDDIIYQKIGLDVKIYSRPIGAFFTVGYYIPTIVIKDGAVVIATLEEGDATYTGYGFTIGFDKVLYSQNSLVIKLNLLYQMTTYNKAKGVFGQYGELINSQKVNSISPNIGINWFFK